jgi:hypothetical protein
VGTKVVVRVISTQGCALEGAEDLKFGSKCELYIDWRGAQIGVLGQVVSQDEAGRLGLKFLSVDASAQKRLGDLCMTLALQPLSAPVFDEVEPRESAATAAPVRAPVPRTAPTPSSPPPKPARERRRVPRYISELRIQLLDPATGASRRVSMVTLSVLGCCLEGEGLPPAGRPCEVQVAWQGTPLRLPGEIVWKSEEQAGVEFRNIEEEVQQLLRRVCANLRLKPLAPLPSEPEK